jgi:hypothetical protein
MGYIAHLSIDQQVIGCHKTHERDVEWQGLAGQFSLERLNGDEESGACTNG